MTATFCVARDRSNATRVSVDVVSPELIKVGGALTFRTAARAAVAGEECLKATAAPSVQVDCADVSAADSAGLAVLLDWVALARRAGRVLHFSHLPPAILAVAAISEVEHLFA